MGESTDIPTDSFLDRVLELDPDQTSNGSIVEGESKARTDEFVCRGCGSELGAGWAFCETCGEPLGAGKNAPYLTPESDRQAADSFDVVHTTAIPKESEAGEQQARVAGHPDATRGDKQRSGTGADLTTPLAVPDSAASDLTPIAGPAPAEEAPPRRRALLAKGAIGIAIASLVAAATVGWVQYNHAQDRLKETRHQLSDTKRSLAFKEDELSATRAELATTQSTLKSTQDELSKTKEDLAKSEGSLNNAQDRLDLQASQIDTLQTCLHGVSEALSDVAYGAYDAAVSALGAVESSCRRASSIL
jgi:hypothetical protein